MTAKLTLSFDPGPPSFERLEITIVLDQQTATEFSSLKLLKNEGFFGLSFNDVCERLSVKQFRKDLFIEQAERLGALLAERMEDAEGWHDESRIEPAKKELAGPTPPEQGRRP